ncbi:hypothetical protein ACSSS7_007430 [Eimeria intestinalis]
MLPLALSRVLLTPPKTPRNIFFPWQTVSIHLSGSFLESRRLALRVPVNLTKFEVKNYLDQIYVGYRRAGCTYKKAIVTLEDPIPDEVKMLRSCRKLGDNPDLLKKNVSYGDDMHLHPSIREDPETTPESPDVRLPFRHGGTYTRTFKPQEIPYQPPNVPGESASAPAAAAAAAAAPEAAAEGAVTAAAATTIAQDAVEQQGRKQPLQASRDARSLISSSSSSNNNNRCNSQQQQRHEQEQRQQRHEQEQQQQPHQQRQQEQEHQ